MVLIILLSVFAAFAQTTEFVYQGQLQNSSVPANGSFDFEFLLFDASMGGSQIGSTLTRNSVAVAQGIFSVSLDFGASFPGAGRFLEIHVRQTGGGAFTALTPRQAVTSAPYSVKSLTADNAAQLGGVAASGYLQTNGNGSGLTNLDAASIATGTLNNARLGQIPTGNIADSAVTAPKIAPGQVVKGVTVGATTLTDNVTLAEGSNITITPAGNTLTIASTGGGGGVGGSGTTNTIPLWSAGTTLGDSVITQSGGNVGIGTATPTDKLTVLTLSSNFGITHTDGIASVGTYVGSGSGGYGGWFGTRSLHPLFFYTNGGSAQMTLTPGGNVGIGTSTPLSRLTLSGSGGQPALAGSRFDIFNTVFNGGFYQWVSNNGYWTLATNNDVQRMVVTPNGNIGIGTPNADDKLTVQTATSSYGLTHTDGTIAVGTFVGGLGGWYGTKSNHPLFFFTNNGNAQMTLTTAGNVGIGTLTPQARLVVNGTSWFNGTGWFQSDTTPFSAAAGRGVGVGMNGAGGYLFAYDYAANAALPLNLNGSGGDVNIGSNLSVNGFVTFAPDGGGSLQLCHNTNNLRIAFCSSSLRYKTNLAPYRGGLNLINQLHPITFDWKEGGMHDLGFGAEDVEKIDRLLVTYNTKGEVEGVKYDRIAAVLVNAVKEQQAQIESQQKMIQAQQQEIEALKQLVCTKGRKAALCVKSQR